MKRVVGQGDFRPMAGNVQAMDDLRRILNGRETLYARADLTLNTSDDSVQESLLKLLDDTEISRKLHHSGE